MVYDGPHKDKSQWKEPDRFVPERFDSLNKEWYLTPDRKQRHAYSFVAFHGGQRVCMGKTFAELVIRFAIPILLHKFDFVPEDKLLDDKDGFNMLMP
jgi:cytochrome P450